MSTPEARALWIDKIENYSLQGKLSPEKRAHLLGLVEEVFPEETWGSLAGEAAAAMSDISKRLLPEIKEHMYAGFQHYGDNHVNLGIKGQFADIWRKIQPLKRALWDGEPLRWESPREICLDLIGHLLLTLRMLDQNGPNAGMVPAEARRPGVYEAPLAGPEEARQGFGDMLASPSAVPYIDTPWYTITFKPGVINPEFITKVVDANERIAREVPGAAGVTVRDA